MFADIHHFVHISHHLPSYVTMTRLGNTLLNVNDEYSELKTNNAEVQVSDSQMFAGHDLNFSELFAFKDDKSGWPSDFSSSPGTPVTNIDMDASGFSFERTESGMDSRYS